MGSVQRYHFHFYPRPPRGGRQCTSRPPKSSYRISIHALREEGDLTATEAAPSIPISIHALREEGDCGLRLTLATPWAISIHALREEGDEMQYKNFPCQYISIHALREEGDFWNKFLYKSSRVISIHALREEGDKPASERTFGQVNFYPRPPRGGRLPCRPCTARP